MAAEANAGSTPAASTNLRLSEAPGEDCRGGAIRRRRAIPMMAPNLLPFSYNSERQYSLKLHFNASLFDFSCQIEKLNLNYRKSGARHLSFINLIPQYSQQLLGRVPGNNLSELGAIIFHQTDAFNDKIVDLPTTAFIGQSIEYRNLSAV